LFEEVALPSITLTTTLTLAVALTGLILFRLTVPLRAIAARLLVSRSQSLTRFPALPRLTAALRLSGLLRLILPLALSALNRLSLLALLAFPSVGLFLLVWLTPCLFALPIALLSFAARG